MAEITWRDIRGVDALYWTPGDAEDPGRPENFGDLLGPLIAEHLAPPTAASSPRRLLSVGSVMHFAVPGDVVWGSGLNMKLHRPWPVDVSQLDVRAARGPLTRAALMVAGASVPAVFGDPGLLLADVLPDIREWTEPKRRAVTVIPNLNDVDLVSDDPRTISPLAPLMDVVRAIAESELVIGSSLHAVIIADSLGVPARFVASGVEHPWKYVDYLAATGRSPRAIASSYEQAETEGGYAPPAWEPGALTAAFPADLWDADSNREPAGAPGVDEVLAAVTTSLDIAERAAGAVNAAVLVDSVLTSIVAPFLERHAATLSEADLDALVVRAARLQSDHGGIGADERHRWIRRAIALHDARALRVRALARTGTSAGPRLLEVVSDPAQGVVSLRGVVDVPIGLPEAPTYRFALARGSGKDAVAWPLEAAMVSDGISGRWACDLDVVEALDAGTYSLTFAWKGERARTPVAGPTGRASTKALLPDGRVMVTLVNDAGAVVVKVRDRDKKDEFA